MDALPPARSWAGHTPSHSPLTAASAILSTPGIVDFKRAHGAEAEDAGVPECFLRWLVGELLSIMACGCTVLQHDAAPKQSPTSGIERSRTWRTPEGLDARAGRAYAIGLKLPQGTVPFVKQHYS